MDPAPPSRRAASRGRPWLVALTLAFVCAVVAHVRDAREHPNNQDRELDLLLARRIVAEGILSDGARSPLFPLLLTVVEGDDPAYYARARWLALALGSLAFAGTYLLLRRALSERTALLSALAFGPEWTFQVSRIRPEPLVAFLVVATTAALALRRGSRRPMLLAVLAGVAAGLAHLGKGSGPLTVAAVLAFLLLTEGRRCVAPILGFLLAFGVTTAPLLVDLSTRFGSPFHNANVAHVMWEAAGEDQLWRWSQATAGTWWSEHGLGGTLSRLVHGFASVKHGPMLYALLAAAGTAWVVRRRRGGGAGALAAWTGLAVLLVLAWLPPFAWYVPIANSRRYLFPLVAVVGPALVGLLDAGLRRVRPTAAPVLDAGTDRAASLLGHPLAIGLAAAALLGADLREAARPPAVGPRAPLSEETLRVADLLRTLPPGTRVLAGPAATVPSPWLVYPRAIYVYLPSRLDASASDRWIRTHADVVLLSPNLVERRPVPFAGWAAVRDDGVLTSLTPPPWAPPWGGSSSLASRYLVRRVTP